MSLSPTELATRIWGEIEDLELALERSQYAWGRAPLVEDQDVYVGYAAAGLQSFYTGLERLFELTAKSMEQRKPSGDAWHIALLQQMAEPVDGVRPAMLSAETAARLDAFRRLRHIVRHIYVFNIETDDLGKMFSAVPEMWKGLRAELLAFAAFLDASRSFPDNIPIETPPG